MDAMVHGAKLRQRLVIACRILARLGLVDYLGHVSVRIPGSDHLLITPRGYAVGGLQSFTPEDLLVIDEDGQPVEGRHPVPSELPIHTEIYRARPDVRSVVHTHQPLATAFSVAGRPIEPVHIVGCELFEAPIPVYASPNLVTHIEQGRAVAATLGAHRLVLLRGHGIVSVGASVEEAVLNAIFLEQQATYLSRSLMLGTPQTLIPAEIRRHRADLERARRPSGERGAWRYYASLVQEGGTRDLPSEKGRPDAPGSPSRESRRPRPLSNRRRR